MSKAEDLAKELYPDWEMTGVPTFDGQEESMVRIQRVAYIEGYHQAEKDLELTVDDICEIMEIREDVLEMDSYENLYEEILKRFKDYKERKEK